MGNLDLPTYSDQVVAPPPSTLNAERPARDAVPIEQSVSLPQGWFREWDITRRKVFWVDGTTQPPRSTWRGPFAINSNDFPTPYDQEREEHERNALSFMAKVKNFLGANESPLRVMQNARRAEQEAQRQFGNSCFRNSLYVPRFAPPPPPEGLSREELDAAGYVLAYLADGTIDYVGVCARTFGVLGGIKVTWGMT